MRSKLIQRSIGTEVLRKLPIYPICRNEERELNVRSIHYGELCSIYYIQSYVCPPVTIPNLSNPKTMRSGHKRFRHIGKPGRVCTQAFRRVLHWGPQYGTSRTMVFCPSRHCRCVCEQFAGLEAADWKDLIFKTNETLEMVTEWILSKYLYVAPEKTESVIDKIPTKRHTIQFAIMGDFIVKYLGAY